MVNLKMARLLCSSSVKRELIQGERGRLKRTAI